MNFDVKDVKSWKDRHDVKVGIDLLRICVSLQMLCVVKIGQPLSALTKNY